MEGLSPKTLGVPLDDKDTPEVDPATIWIVDRLVLPAGDANGAKPLLHEEADKGHIVGLNARAEERVALPRRTPLSVAFCGKVRTRMPWISTGGSRRPPPNALVRRRSSVLVLDGAALASCSLGETSAGRLR